MVSIGELEFMQWLKDGCGYLHPRPLPDRSRYAAIRPLLYTFAIITGKIGDRFSADDRWCYESYEKAKAAFDAWTGYGEPTGWHRHPSSGRRRPGGNPDKEHIAA